ncbi:CaiB/BaiF CoA transferase family protein [Rhizorhabdus dicambivorans]|uniref:CaiB/BaiF CoA transferase family protein n=1 Tax=Rhizorhabdus dicambivorans TaxID=1850238 RepID=UPI000AF6997A|nr:CaiB/BaiF CoA-transferase family protein [Rhizorhabdus dicambivorans]
MLSWKGSGGQGALQGLRIIEIASIGPGPFCAMMLADHGAEVIRIERPGDPFGTAAPLGDRDVLLRSRAAHVLDLKDPAVIAAVRALARDADGLIEGFRPGVMERLGLGPALLLADNPRLVYGRMTGWGQAGPLAPRAGHDINYIARAGNLHGYGRAGGKPTPPINAVGDFGGGGMMLAFGMLAGVMAARRTGQGQVIDCAMVDGAGLIGAMTWSFLAQGQWADERGVNLLDSGAPFYDSYETADGRHVAIGALEPQFYALLLDRLGLTDDPLFARQHDRATWPAMRARLEELFRSRSRDDWTAIFEDCDACFAPVLSLAEAPLDPHSQVRAAFIDVGGHVQPAPAPRFSATPASPPSAGWLDQ